MTSSGWLRPTSSVVASGVNSSRTTVAGGTTVTDAEADLPSTVAVMMLMPMLCAVTTPAADTLATAGALRRVATMAVTAVFMIVVMQTSPAAAGSRRYRLAHGWLPRRPRR